MNRQAKSNRKWCTRYNYGIIMYYQFIHRNLHCISPKKQKQTFLKSMWTNTQSSYLLLWLINLETQKCQEQVKVQQYPAKNGPDWWIIYYHYWMHYWPQAEQEWNSIEDKQRFLRLQHLLEKSHIYCQFLLERMESQKKETQKQQERLAKKLEKKENKEQNTFQQVHVRHMWLQVV